MEIFSEKLGKYVVEGLTEGFKTLTGALGATWQHGAHRENDGSKTTAYEDLFAWGDPKKR